MLKTYEKFRMIDEDKKNDWFIEVNWKKDPIIAESKILKVTFPNGDVAFLRRELLNEMLFVIGKPEDQQKMIPQKLTHMKWYETVLSIKATKNIRKGEGITFPIKISLPPSQEEIIGKHKVGSGLYVPKK